MLGNEEQDKSFFGASREGGEDKPKRERSRIEFPYADLENAITLVQALRDHAGTQCSTSQLAAWMNQSSSGGTFRSRLSAARIFGLIEVDRGSGSITATNLGLSIANDAKNKASLVEAFLNVELFEALYGVFEGHALPPAAALERQIGTLGVAEKQKDRARQTFVKSAQYAGFIDGRSGRFIKPGVKELEESESRDSANSDDADNANGGRGGEGPPPRDPLIEGLFAEIPSREEGWNAEDQLRWLETAAHVFALVYKRREKIRIDLENPSGGAIHD